MSYWMRVIFRAGSILGCSHIYKVYRLFRFLLIALLVFTIRISIATPPLIRVWIRISLVFIFPRHPQIQIFTHGTLDGFPG